jgi:hypothetical protein
MACRPKLFESKSEALQPFFSESSTGTGLQIAFEVACFLFVFECGIPSEFPWFEW